MWSKETKEGTRFEFGKNWRKFSLGLTRKKIERSKSVIRDFLGLENLKGLTFIDVGSGSGIMSLAAVELGARVVSFDYDADSVETTKSLREKNNISETEWKIIEESVLNERFIEDLGTFDIVYSWGVLHHTGDMVKALEHAGRLVKNQGLLYVAIYNDQGWLSRFWLNLKIYYNSSFVLRPFLIIGFLIRSWLFIFLKDLIRYGNPTHTWMRYGEKYRGMSPWYDLIDWIGGLPFEVAKPEVIFDFYKERGFNLLKLVTVRNGRACNQFVFRKI